MMKLLIIITLFVVSFIMKKETEHRFSYRNILPGHNFDIRPFYEIKYRKYKDVTDKIHPLNEKEKKIFEMLKTIPHFNFRVYGGWVRDKVSILLSYLIY